ncbi:tyrosine-protein phosphatase [Streptomyces sp. NPDC018000]|uniref:tyrosine-protein phosphatase n=1 Tax=Streptomyces sp. NPDC018000 TaxID=3365028 RepID=UPI0037BA77EB
MRNTVRGGLALAAVVALVGPLVPAAAAAAAAAGRAPAVHAASLSTLTAGRVREIPGTVNARDVGGYRTYDGETTRWSVVYRSDSLAKLPPEGVTALGGLGLSAVIDLRTPAEVQADGADKLPAGVTAVALPVDDTSLFAFIGSVVLSKDPAHQQAQLGDGKAEERMRALYRGFVTNSANRAALGAAVKRVANSAGPVLFHCSAGKDRTGVLADTILRAVGVPSATAEGDYLLSNELRADADKALRDQVKAAGYMQNPDLLIPLQEVRSSYLAAFRDQATASYGSFGKFLTDGLGLDFATLYRLRERLVT